MANEGFEQIATVLKRSGMRTRHVGEFVDVGNRKVRHGIALEVSPQVFDRIQLRRVGRKEYAAYVPMRFQKITHDNRSMGLQAVPDHHERRTELAIQLGEERHDASRVDIGVAVQTKVQPNPIAFGCDTQRTNHTDFAMRASALTNDGRLPARCPTTPNQRGHQKRRFVDENQPGSQARGVFFTRGHSDFTQVAMAVSSRSSARRVGFCALQPSARINRPMWSM